MKSTELKSKLKKLEKLYQTKLFCHLETQLYYQTFLNGLKVSMSFGNKVKTEIIANNIAIPVKTPKYIVGIKLDNINIEKPNTIVIDVFNIATPTVS